MKISYPIFIFSCTILLIDVVSGVPQRTTAPWQPKFHDHDYEELTPTDQLPKILTTNSVVRAVEGDNVTLLCDVVKLGKYSVVWHKESSIIWVLQGEPSEIQHVTSDDRFGNLNTSLLIRNVTVDDEAVYSCEVSSNSQHKVHQQLIVSVPPSAWPTDRKGFVQEREGTSVQLDCSVYGRPTPNVTWHREDDKDLTGIASYTTYVIANSTPADAGRYFCVADNGVREPARALFTLDIHYPPVVFSEITTVHTGVNYDATLSCVVDSSPFPRVDWLKEGAPVNPMRLDKGIKNKRFSLVFGNVIREDFGFYSCNASNFYGNDSAVMELTGRPLSPIVTSPSQGDLPDQYTLTWDVKSYSPVTYYVLLLRNFTDTEDGWVNITVPGTTGSSMYHSQRYILRDLAQKFPMIAKIKATNEFGDSEWSLPFAFKSFDDSEDSLIPRDEDNFIFESPAEQSEAQKFKQDHQIGLISANDSETPASVDNESPKTNFTNSSDIPFLFSSQRVSPNASSAARPTLTPSERRAQMTALLTAISLSAFFF